MLEKPPLCGTRVSLRALGPEDAEAMYQSIQDPEGVRLTGSHGTFTRELVAAHCERVAAAEDRLDYVIALRDDPTYRGEVVLRHIDPDNRCVTVWRSGRDCTGSRWRCMNSIRERSAPTKSSVSFAKAASAMRCGGTGAFMARCRCRCCATSSRRGTGSRARFAAMRSHEWH